MTTKAIFKFEGPIRGGFWTPATSFEVPYTPPFFVEGLAAATAIASDPGELTVLCDFGIPGRVCIASFDRCQLFTSPYLVDSRLPLKPTFWVSRGRSHIRMEAHFIIKEPSP